LTIGGKQIYYEELIKEHAPKWTYPVNYGKESEVSCDILVLGGPIQPEI
jgi:hypothetical protein